MYINPCQHNLKILYLKNNQNQPKGKKMRINHEIVLKLKNQVKKEKTAKEIGFDNLQLKFGLNTTFRTKDIYKAFFKNYHSKMSLGVFPWHIYGWDGYLLKPGRDGRYLHKVGYGAWRLCGEKY
jgi:hypothetical protein